MIRVPGWSVNNVSRVSVHSLFFLHLLIGDVLECNAQDLLVHGCHLPGTVFQFSGELPLAHVFASRNPVCAVLGVGVAPSQFPIEQHTNKQEVLNSGSLFCPA